MKAFKNLIIRTEKRKAFLIDDFKCFSLGLQTGDAVLYKLIKNTKKLKNGFYVFDYQGKRYFRYLSFDYVTGFVYIYSYETDAPEFLTFAHMAEIEKIGKVTKLLKMRG